VNIGLAHSKYIGDFGDFGGFILAASPMMSAISAMSADVPFFVGHYGLTV
jgi:hypothetical protein